MSEYIERERARHECKNFFKGDEKAQDDCESLLCMLPAADVAPVGRGHWLDVGCYDIGFWQCSCCGFLSEAIAAPKLYKYCPNCGKKMETNNYEERN